MPQTLKSRDPFPASGDRQRTAGGGAWAAAAGVETQEWATDQSKSGLSWWLGRDPALPTSGLT